MNIGFIGLGKMGSQMVARLLDAGNGIVVSDHHQENIDAAVAHGAVAATGREDLAAKLAAQNESGAPLVVWLMIAAQAVDAELAALLPLLPAGSIVVDGGNSDFRDTRRHAETCAAANVQLVDVGTSGGILGLKNGFSIMVGGSELAFKTIEPLIQALAQADGYGYFGPSGAGHYVKMIHNAIEYGVMESYAEGYNLLKNGRDFPALDLPKIAGVWQHGSIIESGLNGIIAEQLAENPELSGIDGFVHESGEARWTLETAAAQNENSQTAGGQAEMQTGDATTAAPESSEKIELPAIQIALDARLASQKGKTNFGTKLLAAMRNGFGGHALNK